MNLTFKFSLTKLTLMGLMTKVRKVYNHHQIGNTMQQLINDPNRQENLDSLPETRKWIHSNQIKSTVKI